MIMDAALTAGKKSRNDHVVPSIVILKGEKADPEYVRKTSETVANLVIKPGVEACVEKFLSMCNADSVATFRQRAEELAEGKSELLWLRKQIHQPTVDLRQGKSVDVEHLLDKLRSHLVTRRRANREKTVTAEQNGISDSTLSL